MLSVRLAHAATLANGSLTLVPRQLASLNHSRFMSNSGPNDKAFYGWKETQQLRDKITHYAQFPATGVSLRQMVQFGSFPSDGTLFRASQFIVEELPIRLAHRVKDLETLPLGLSKMPSINRVKDWYSQSFDELTSIMLPPLEPSLKNKLYNPEKKARIKLPLVNATLPDMGIMPEVSNYPSSLGPLAATSRPMVDHHNHQHHQTHHHQHHQTHGQQQRAHPRLESAQAARKYFAQVEDDVQWPTIVQDYNRTVTQALQKIKARHDGVVPTIAQGVMEWKDSQYFSEDDRDVQIFLDRFYMSRIGIRMLIGQHIALNMDRGLRDDYVGIIGKYINVKEVVQAAIDNARFICEDWYGLFEAPKVQLHQNADNINFMYVPGHLSHIVFEVVKNSLRAVVESHGVDYDAEYPPVKVVIVQGDEDITIKISDEGGGIPRRAVDKVWTYMYTTAQDMPPLDQDITRSDFKAPLAGFGYGLPVSRLYARYFGGNLDLISMEGYGTDVYLHLNRLSSAAEPLT